MPALPSDLSGKQKKLVFQSPQFSIVRWGWWRAISLRCGSWEMRPSPCRGVPVKLGNLNCSWFGTEQLGLCLICLSVQKDKLSLGSGVCFFTLKTKGAPLIPFTMSHCDFTWNCCSCLPRKQDEIKLRGIYLFAFWAGMCAACSAAFVLNQQGLLEGGNGNVLTRGPCLLPARYKRAACPVTISQGLSRQR